jgi:S1-C subfamily serine protease
MTRALQLRLASIAVLAGFLAFACPPSASQLRAQEDLQAAVRKAVEDANKDLVRQVTALIEKRHAESARAAEEAQKKQAARIAELEKAIQERDARLAALDKRVAELSAQLAGAGAQPKKATEPAAAPAAKASVAFLGVGHIDDKDGARVTTVHPGSPAAAAGVQVGDLITAIADKAVSSESLPSVVTSLKAGDSVKLSVVREGKKLDLSAKLADRNEFFAGRVAKEEPKKAEPAAPAAAVVLGVTVEQSKDGSGIVVYEVEDGFTGHVAGLVKGDRIQSVNGAAVKTLDEITAAKNKVKVGEKLVLVIDRGAETIEVSVVGAAGKGEAKLVEKRVIAGAAKEAEKPKDAAAKKPAFLGVSLSEQDEGLRVEDVVADAAAAVYGIEKGDLLVKANGKDLREMDHLAALLKGLSAGDKLDLVLKRRDVAREVKGIVLGAPGEKVKAPEVKTAEAPKPKVEDPKPAERKRGVFGFAARETADGHILVSDVTPGGPADKAGVKAGDLLLKVGDTAVKNFDDLENVMKSLFSGDQVTLRIKRGEEEKEIRLTLGAPAADGLGE